DQVLRVLPQTSEHVKQLQHLCDTLLLDLVLICGVQKQLDSSTPREGPTPPPKKVTGGFQRAIPKLYIIQWKSIYYWMYQIKESNSELVAQHYLGVTYGNQPKYYLKISQPSNKAKKIIWMDCGIHAREWISSAFCQWFVKEILQNYKTDPKIKSFLQNLDICILPVLSIDGYIYSWKTLSGDAVEDTRIFSSGLGWASRHKAFFQKTKVNVCTLAAEKAAVALKGKHGTNFTVGPTSLVLYKNSGSSRDWAHMIGIPFSYTFELRDTGAYGFILLPDQIQPTCEETTTAVMTIIEYVNQKYFPNSAVAMTSGSLWLWLNVLFTWTLS
ncbi:unnamed protein product, partial [Natator depressus]